MNSESNLFLFKHSDNLSERTLMSLTEKCSDLLEKYNSETIQQVFENPQAKLDFMHDIGVFYDQLVQSRRSQTEFKFLSKISKDCHAFMELLIQIWENLDDIQVLGLVLQILTTLLDFFPFFSSELFSNTIQKLIPVQLECSDLDFQAVILRLLGTLLSSSDTTSDMFYPVFTSLPLIHPENDDHFKGWLFCFCMFCKHGKICGKVDELCNLFYEIFSHYKSDTNSHAADDEFAEGPRVHSRDVYKSTARALSCLFEINPIGFADSLYREPQTRKVIKYLLCGEPPLPEIGLSIMESVLKNEPLRAQTLINSNRIMRIYKLMTNCLPRVQCKAVEILSRLCRVMPDSTIPIMSQNNQWFVDNIIDLLNETDNPQIFAAQLKLLHGIFDACSSSDLTNSLTIGKAVSALLDLFSQDNDELSAEAFSMLNTMASAYINMGRLPEFVALFEQQLNCKGINYDEFLNHDLDELRNQAEMLMFKLHPQEIEY